MLARSQDCPEPVPLRQRLGVLRHVGVQPVRSEVPAQVCHHFCRPSQSASANLPRAEQNISNTSELLATTAAMKCHRMQEASVEGTASQRLRSQQRHLRVPACALANNISRLALPKKCSAGYAPHALSPRVTLCGRQHVCVVQAIGSHVVEHVYLHGAVDPGVGVQSAIVVQLPAAARICDCVRRD